MLRACAGSGLSYPSQQPIAVVAPIRVAGAEVLAGGARLLSLHPKAVSSGSVAMYGFTQGPVDNLRAAIAGLSVVAAIPIQSTGGVHGPVAVV